MTHLSGFPAAQVTSLRSIQLFLHLSSVSYLGHCKPRILHAVHFQLVCHRQVLLDHGLSSEQEDVVQIDVGHHFQLLLLLHVVLLHFVDQVAHRDVHQEAAVLVVHG